MFTPRFVPLLALSAVAVAVPAQSQTGYRYPAEKTALAPLPDTRIRTLSGGSPQPTATPTKQPEKEKPTPPLNAGQNIVIINNASPYGNAVPYGGYYPPTQSSGFSSSFSTPGWSSGHFSMPPWSSSVTSWNSGPAYGPAYGQALPTAQCGQPAYGYPNYPAYPAYPAYPVYVAPAYPTYIPGPSVQGYRGAAGYGPSYGGNCSPGTTIGTGGITFTWRGR